MKTETLQQYAQLAAVVIVVFGCYQILHPFIPAILFSAVACSSSWPLYARLRRALRGRSNLAALLMTLGLVVLVIGPTTALAASLADDVGAAVQAIKELLEQGPLQPPEWLKTIPLVGESLDGYWHRLAGSREELVAALKSLIEPARAVVVVAGKAIGSGLLQMALATFICFFFYRDGEALVQSARGILARLAGGLADELLATIDNTVTGVVQGIFGTALAQALVAILGFVIAGVPGALLLGTATFFLSMVPVGPPLIWGGAAAWLFYQGSVGWAIFMLIWGLLVISSIDNFVKPYLISRTSSLPLLLIVFGVFGGIVAFGFIGVFIGPPVLAVGLTLVQLWTTRSTGPALIEPQSGGKRSGP
ncbi:AI-2E family transporter [Roseateles violae]|uniref:AI-2E family transporter n=1 Tax=Roseateles violae TaxID=3058042 RepID=A0ABT8DPN7_9BURK|nr:AI-2E family transporter [Pelomonas sp. PFR6]MDN3918904.1 AI-2E family transporter [Pelomonas sp. PFR6]